MSERYAHLSELLARHGRRLLEITQRIFLVAALLAITYYLARHAGELRSLLSWRTGLHCLAAALLLVVAHPLTALAFFQLQRHTGVAVDLPTSLAIYLRRIPARYVPGGIWHSVSRMADMRLDAGASGAQLRRLFAYETALVATSGLLACALTLVVFSVRSPIGIAAAVQAGIGIVAACAVLLLAGRHGCRRLLTALLLLLAVWSLAAVMFTTIVDGMGMNAASGCGIATTASTYLVAAVQGYLAIFAPQGWGVAEASFALFDPCGRALHQVLAAFLLYRLSAIGGDLLAYATWKLAARRSAAARLPSVEVD